MNDKNVLVRPDGGVCIRIQREYNNYPIGDYFEPDR